MQLNAVYAAAGVTYQGRETIYSGSIQGRDFVFQGRSIIEINNQCETFYKTKIGGSTDLIKVSVNFGPVENMKNTSSYWKSGFEVCQQVLQRL